MKNYFKFKLFLGLVANLCNMEISSAQFGSTSQTLSLSKPFVELSDVKKICDCISSSRINEFSITNTSINMDLIRKYYLRYPNNLSCLDLNNDRRVNILDLVGYQTLFNKLNSPSQGFLCTTFLDVEARIQNPNNSYRCRARNPRAVVSHLDPTPRANAYVINGRLNVDGVDAFGDIFEQSSNENQTLRGAVEFRRFQFRETNFNNNGPTGTLMNQNELRSRYAISPLVSEGFAKITQSSPSASSRVSFKECGFPNLDSGHVAVAYCEIKGLNGVVFSEAPNLSNQMTAVYTGNSNWCRRTR